MKVTTSRTGWLLATVTCIVAVLIAAAAMNAPAVHAQQGPPATTVSGDGRTVSGGGKSLTASTVTDLDPTGAAVTVDGAGYDETKGIYVTLCVVPPPGQVPTPCGGGQDRDASSGASAWVSSDPPSGGENLVAPYGPGGSFSVTLTVSSTINTDLDCRQVRCAIVTRNDHTRGTDRSQDLFLPVTFRTDDAPATTVPTTTATTMTSSTTTTTTTTVPVTLADDGRSARSGGRSVTVDAVADLDPSGATVTVDGDGLDPGVGVYLALCRLPDPDAAATAAAGRPGPCLSGDDASAWFADDPPDYGTGVAEPLGEGGTFTAELAVQAVIDGETDCRDVACGIGIRRDDADAADRTQDLFVPVSFAAEASPEDADATGAGDAEIAASSDGTDDVGEDGGTPLVPLAVGGVLLSAGAGWWWRRSSNRQGPIGET